VLFVDGTDLAQEALAERARKTAEDILKICHGVRLENVPNVDFSCSIGIALRNVNGTTYTALYECADKAMYAVKKSGKNNYRFAD
jgi:GGDEF domain-containing protein